MQRAGRVRTFAPARSFELPDEHTSPKGQAIKTTSDETEPDLTRHPSQQLLSESACLQLLPTAPIGRLAYTKAGMPASLLTKIRVENGSILFSTGDLDVLRAAERGYVVAFEADAIDPGQRLRWTVTIVGHLKLLATSKAAELTASPSTLRETQLIPLAIAATQGQAEDL